VDAAYNVGKPPPELSLAWNCERYNCLPDAGGYLDQDYICMMRMNVYSNVYNIVAKWQTLNAKTIHTLSDSERLYLRRLHDMGLVLT